MNYVNNSLQKVNSIFEDLVVFGSTSPTDSMVLEIKPDEMINSWGDGVSTLNHFQDPDNEQQLAEQADLLLLLQIIKPD